VAAAGDKAAVPDAALPALSILQLCALPRVRGIFGVFLLEVA
jgi:hypothetical protein